jgi:hypothetical protein
MPHDQTFRVRSNFLNNDGSHPDAKKLHPTLIPLNTKPLLTKQIRDNQTKELTSSTPGVATLIPKHQLRTGSMTLEGLLQHTINLHNEEYFSVVLRNAACTGLVHLSTSSKTTAL